MRTKHTLLTPLLAAGAAAVAIAAAPIAAAAPAAGGPASVAATPDTSAGTQQSCTSLGGT